MNDKPTVFAVDFGTTNSLLAAANRDQIFAPIALDSEAPDPTVLASALYFFGFEQRSFGVAAPREFIRNGFQGRLIRSIKRHLPSAAFTATRIGDVRVTLPELIGSFLSAMRERACQHFDCEVKSAVFGRPARFSTIDSEDQLAEARLAEAAMIAGFEQVNFCPEPIAAAHDMADQLREPKTVLVVDLGGGTSDFTVVRLGPSGFRPSDVLAVGGITVAGDVIDGSLVRSMVAPELGSLAPYRLPFGKNILTMPRELLDMLCSSAELTLLDRAQTLRRLSDISAALLSPHDRPKLNRFAAIVEDGVGFQLYSAVEWCKRRLSYEAESLIELDYPGATLSIAVSRAELEAAAQRPIERIMQSLDETLRAAGITESQVDIMCATGGTARMPLIRQALTEKFPKTHFHELSSFHSVVQGLALRAQEMLNNHEI